ncbi:hypothetical protein H696_02655 [Fonticula alba]|uniref:Uncharacterized protein n=1 Tax=Fonticula alba TaxID=691883 RepID=A0A058Z8R9_FONAL|nr:hypothetical protein H696_02655 [Fonticula alba]KCV70328.1 hypothetical protein H696_02655 [Fonticula alba]|eukprot:XP_009494844.1 hypothetical protein H696_02655 [Fonticula alba]
MARRFPCSHIETIIGARRADIQELVFSVGVGASTHRKEELVRILGMVAAAQHGAEPTADTDGRPVFGAPVPAFLRPTGQTILSIDVGLRNMALALIEARRPALAEAAARPLLPPLRLLEWMVIPVDGLPDAFNLPQYARAVSDFVDQRLPLADVNVLERQMRVFASNSSIGDSINIISGQLQVALLRRVMPLAPARDPFFCGLASAEANPKLVAGIFDLAQGYSRKKNSSMRLVERLLAAPDSSLALPGGTGISADNRLAMTATDADGQGFWPLARTLHVPEHLAARFHAAQKKDDMSDALLQAVATALWRDQALYNVGRVLGCRCDPRSGEECCLLVPSSVEDALPPGSDPHGADEGAAAPAKAPATRGRASRAAKPKAKQAADVDAESQADTTPKPPRKSKAKSTVKSPADDPGSLPEAQPSHAATEEAPAPARQTRRPRKKATSAAATE